MFPVKRSHEQAWRLFSVSCKWYFVPCIFSHWKCAECNMFSHFTSIYQFNSNCTIKYFCTESNILNPLCLQNVWYGSRETLPTGHTEGVWQHREENLCCWHQQNPHRSSQYAVYLWTLLVSWAIEYWQKYTQVVSYLIQFSVIDSHREKYW